MLNKKRNKNIKRIITFTLLFMLALVTSPLGQVTKVDALQPKKQSGTGTAKNQTYWDDVGRSFILTDTQSYVTSLSKADAGFIVNTDTTSIRYSDARNKTVTDVLSGGEHRIRGSHAVRRWDGTNGWYNFSFRLVPANFVQGSYTKGRSLLDNLYLESSTSASTIDSRLANGTHGWINPIISVSRNATHASLKTQRLWSQGSGNYVRPAQVYSRSADALGAASWGTATANYFRDAWDMKVSLPKIDQFPPTITFSPHSNGTYSTSNRTTSITVTDAGTGVKQYRTRIETTSGGTTTTSGWSGYTTSGKKTITFSGNGRQRVQVQATDNNGNTSTKWSGYFYVDKKAPTLNSYTVSKHRYKNGNDYWFRPGDPWEVELVGYDNNSGHKINYIRLSGTNNDNRAVHYYADAGTKIDEWMKGTYTTITSGREVYKGWTHQYVWGGTVKSNSGGRNFNVQYYFTDQAGNTVGYNNTGARFRVDGVNPVISANTSSRSWGNSNASVTLSYSDALSGVKTKQYAWSTSTSTPSSWSNYSSAVSRSSNGAWYLHAKSTDNVGNVWTTRFGPYRVDKTAPNGTISKSTHAWTNGNVTLTFNATDSGGSGVRRVRQSGGTWVNGSTTSRTVTANGTYSFEVEDNAGNTRTVSTTVSQIDKTAPTNGITQTPTAWTNQPVRLLVQGSDTQSGIQKIEPVNQSTDAGRNLLTKSQELSTFSRYQGATATAQDNVSVPEWGVTDATRIRTVRASEDFQIHYGFNPNNSINWIDAAGQTYTYSVNIRNDGNSDIIVAQNGIRGASNTIKPGESKRISSTGTVRDSPAYNFIQVHFRSSGNMNMVLWGQKAEKGSTATPYTPSPEEKTKENLLTDGNVSKSTSEYMVSQYNLNEPLEAGKTYTMTIKGTKKSSQNFGLWQNVGSTGRGNLTHLGNNIYELTFTAASPISGRAAIENKRVRIYQPSSGTRGPATIEWARLVKHDSSPKTGMHHAVADYEVTQNGTYTFRITDNVGNYRDQSITVSNIDTIKPNGTITGNPTNWTNQNATLTFNATDSGGSGVRRVRQSGGTWVNGSTTSRTVTANGTYSFEVEDNAGNTRTVSVTVNRIDKAKPGGTISGNPTTWTNGNATLTFKATDSGGSGVRRVRQSGGTWVNGSTTSRTVTINGTYSFEVEDNAGNTHTVSVVVNRIDKTLPSGTISGNPTSWTNQNVTLKFTATDSGGSGVRRVRQSGGTWVNGSTTSRTVTANGTYSFEVEDNAGNTRTVSVTVNRIDKTIPGGTISGNPTSWTNQNVTLTFNATDSGGSGVRRVRQSGGTWVNGSTTSRTVTANGTYSFEVEDNAGNTRTVSVTVNRIDKTIPGGTISGNPTAWTNQNVTLSFNATDSGGSGVKRVRTPNGTWVNGSSANQVVTQNGTYTFRVEDNAGNIRDVSVVVNRIDKTLPSGTISGNPSAWTNKNVTLTFNATDSGGAGVKRVRTPNGTWVNGSSASQVVTQNGTYTFRVEDNAGNIRDVSVVVNRIDKTIPGGTISGNPTSWTNKDVTLRLNATDTGGSNVKRIRLPNGNWVNGATASQIVKSNGIYIFRVEDNATNFKDISAEVRYIDKTSPSESIIKIKIQ